MVECGRRLVDRARAWVRKFLRSLLSFYFSELLLVHLSELILQSLLHFNLLVLRFYLHFISVYFGGFVSILYHEGVLRLWLWRSDGAALRNRLTL